MLIDAYFTVILASQRALIEEGRYVTNHRCQINQDLSDVQSFRKFSHYPLSLMPMENRVKFRCSILFCEQQNFS